MKIRRDLLQIASGVREADGTKTEPEQQPVQRIIETSAGANAGGQSVGQLPVRFVSEMSAGELANVQERLCATCVAEGTLVFADGGLVPVEQAVASGVRQTFLDGSWRDVSARVFTGEKEVLEVVTTHGARFTVTPDHRVMTERGWVCAADLRSAFRPNGVRDNRDVLDAPIEFEMAKTDAIDRKDALLIGALVGDGWTARPNGKVIGTGFCFAEDMREEFAPLLAYAAERLGSVERPHLQKRNQNGLVKCENPQLMYRIDWRNKEAQALGRWLSKDHVPTAFWRSTPESIGAYLRGLFSTDGSIGLTPRPTAHFYQTSPTLIAEVQMLLRSIGIYSTVSTLIRAPRYKNLMNLTVARHASLERFIDLVGFVDAHRQHPLEQAVMGRRGKSKGGFERVRSVTPVGVARVYDLSVPGPEAFLANGVRVHNCKHFDHKAFQNVLRNADAPAAPMEKRQAVNEIRSALIMSGNANLNEMHSGLDGDFDVEAALKSCGVCQILTHLDNDLNVFHPTASCPAHVITPTQPHGYYQPKDRAAKKEASAQRDAILRQAQGKIVT